MNEETAKVLIVFVIVSIFSFVVYDRCSGTTELVMATIYDKEHRVSHSRDKNGHESTSHYYYLTFKMDKGGYEEESVSSWNYHSARVGQRVVLKFTVGGKSGMRYFVSYSDFKGAEQ